MNPNFQTRCLSSLAKVFADEELQAPSYTSGSALLGEVYSFQVAYYNKGWNTDITVRIESDLEAYITARSVGLVPSEMPCYPDHDDDILRATPGLYPDTLLPIEKDGVKAVSGQWRSIWITVKVPHNAKPGLHTIKVIVANLANETIGEERFELTVIGAELPKQTLIYTNWFHSDCIATHYGLEVFSEEHWQRIDQYITTAVQHGMNMILTPIFTPPLDTEIGGERPTVQLVDVIKEGSNYQFGFDRLKRWVDLCLNRGIEYFEFSHLFTQWGVEHAPKIVATVDGEEKRIFGWDTDAGGPEYESFLNQFLPALVAFIKQNNLEGRSYFHISDEPYGGHLVAYERASRMLSAHLADFPIIDALSEYEFYKRGLVKKPIPANNHIEPFIENNVPDLWTYYCCSQYKEVSNRLFNMPSARNRILGVQMYKFKIAGFLHWGYNFWYTYLSRKAIDPYRVTDGGYWVPSGDACVVYPGQDGPIESLRFEVFYEGLQDMRALQLLESLIGRDQVIALLEEDSNGEITFSKYPRGSEWMLNKREQINRKIAECVG